MGWRRVSIAVMIAGRPTILRESVVSPGTSISHACQDSHHNRSKRWDMMLTEDEGGGGGDGEGE
eukprot:2650991-Rhodomonas_salina.5